MLKVNHIIIEADNTEMLSKQEVNYREQNRCGICKFFMPY